MKATVSGETPTLPQIAVARFMRSGAYDRHLKLLRQKLKHQVSVARKAVYSFFPDGTRVSDPSGGFVLWIELPPSVDSLELHREALREKISIAPGPIFSNNQHYQNFIRISCGQPWTPRTEAALKMIGNLARRLADKKRRKNGKASHLLD